MWLWVLIGLNIISKLHGYPQGNISQSCESMLPLHRSFTPQTSESPYMVTYQHGSTPGDPITVSLESKGSGFFRGFMLQARELSLGGEGPAVGQFFLLDSRSSQLLKCDDLMDSAVSHTNNFAKTSLRVNWIGPDDVLFRATFVLSVSMFWERVNVTVARSTTTPTPSTAMPTSTTSAAMPTSVPTTKKPDNITDPKVLAAITLMCLDSVLVEVKKETFNIVSFASTPNFHYIKKVVMIICSSSGILFDIASLVLLRLSHSYQVSLVALVSVVIVITSIELVIALLPIGPSHELERKEICEIALRVCFAIHHIFTIAVVFTGVIYLKNDQGEDTRNSWLVSVMIAYTVWIVLAEVWDFLLCVNRRTILKRDKTESSKHRQRRDPQSRKCVGAVKVIVLVVSVILVAGTASFAAAVIFGLYQHQEN